MCRWSCASANQLPRYRQARARVRAAGLSFWSEGRRCALSVSKHDAPSSSSSPCTSLEMSFWERALLHWGKCQEIILYFEAEGGGGVGREGSLCARPRYLLKTTLLAAVEKLCRRAQFDHEDIFVML